MDTDALVIVHILYNLIGEVMYVTHLVLVSNTGSISCQVLAELRR